MKERPMGKITVYRAKKVLTMDPGRPVAEAVAVMDGRIVGAGTSTYLDRAVTLNGGSVAPDARGHGAYRALVRARWEDAVARGTPVLITQAGRMSAPILERLGFEEIARMHILIDRFG